MRFLRPATAMTAASTLLLLAACRTVPAPPPPPPPPVAITPEYQGVATQALKTLEDYWGKTPETAPAPPLRLVYFVAADREPLPQYQERITGWFNDFQEFFRSEFARNGYGPRELKLERNPDGSVKLHMVRGQKPDREYTYKSGQDICKEAREGLKGVVDFDHETALIICALSKTENGKILLYAPYYGLGLGDQMKGTALVVDQEQLAIPNLADQERQVVIGEHQERTMNLGQYNTTYIGGTLHELGHALSLPHDYQTGAEVRRGVPLMGAGNYTYRNDRHGQKQVTYLSFSEATRLLSQPLFSGRNGGRELFPTADFKEFRLQAGADSASIEAKIEASVPVYAVVAYVDKDGGDDYDSKTFVTAVDGDGRFYLSIPDLNKGEGWLRLCFCHANGAISQVYKHYRNAGDGSQVAFADAGQPTSAPRKTRPPKPATTKP